MKTLRKHWLGMPMRTHWQRLEDSISLGLPDVSAFAARRGDCWIEGKELDKLPKRNTTPVKVGLRLEQQLWLTEAQEAGRRVIVAVRTPELWLFFNRGFGLLYSGEPWSMLLEQAALAVPIRDLGRRMPDLLEVIYADRD